jgi:hypothetical protein
MGEQLQLLRQKQTSAPKANFCAKSKLLRQKEVVAPGYCAPKTKGGKDKKEAWVNT